MRAAVGSLSSHDGLRSRQYIFAIPELVPVESVYARMPSNVFASLPFWCYESGDRINVEQRTIIARPTKAR